jgi:hypothetical protein
MTAAAQLWGTMHGEVVTVWLNMPVKSRWKGVTLTRREARKMRLHPDCTLTFERMTGEIVRPAPGFVFDGASIPIWFWFLIGSPFTGRYREAAVIHDWLCKQQDRPAKQAHYVFYECARSLGVAKWRATIMYRVLLLVGSKW